MPSIWGGAPNNRGVDCRTIAFAPALATITGSLAEEQGAHGRICLPFSDPLDFGFFLVSSREAPPGAIEMFAEHLGCRDPRPHPAPGSRMRSSRGDRKPSICQPRQAR